MKQGDSAAQWGVQHCDAQAAVTCTLGQVFVTNIIVKVIFAVAVRPTYYSSLSINALHLAKKTVYSSSTHDRSLF
jgi:hypothetical protein